MSLSLLRATASAQKYRIDTLSAVRIYIVRAAQAALYAAAVTTIIYYCTYFFFFFLAVSQYVSQTLRTTHTHRRRVSHTARTYSANVDSVATAEPNAALHAAIRVTSLSQRFSPSSPRPNFLRIVRREHTHTLTRLRRSVN